MKEIRPLRVPAPTLRGRAAGWARALAFPLALLAAPVACDRVSSDNIETWKSTQKGPGKLEAALRNSSVDPALRAQAALALVEIQMADSVDAALAAMPAAESAQVVKALVPIATGALKAATTSTKAADARDLLVSARPYAAEPERSAIDAAVLDSVVAELGAGRPLSGRHSLQKIVTTIGPAAAPALVRVLETPKATFIETAELLAKVGDDTTREQGGAALVKLAEKSKPVAPALWRAIGALGGPTAIEWLKGRVAKGGEGAEEAARGLQQRKDPALLPWALGLAANPGTPKGVREEMFGLVELTGGAAARDGLVRIIADDKDELVRYRAYEAALAAGKASAVVPALEAFPAKGTYKPDDVKDYLVKDIEKLGAAARAEVVRALDSASPVARFAAVWALESPKIGSAAEAAALKKVASDKGTLKGFPSGLTVGKEATRVAGLLAKR